MIINIHGYNKWTNLCPSPQKEYRSYTKYTKHISNSSPQFFLSLNTSFVYMNYQPRQCNTSYIRAFRVDCSLSGKMTSKLIIRESELHEPCRSDITNDAFLGHYPIHK